MASLYPRRWTTPKGAVKRGWEVAWTEVVDGERKRRSKLFSRDKPDALARARRFRNKMEDPDAPAVTAEGEPVTVTAAGQAWVDAAERAGRSRYTVDYYQRQLDLHIAPARVDRGDGTEVAFGKLLVSEVTPPLCEALKRWLLTHRGEKLTAKVLVSVRSLFRQAVRDGHLSVSPAAATRQQAVDRGEDEVIIPEPAEVKALLKAVTSAEPAAPTYAEVWIRMTMMTGMRPSENLGAAIEDLVLEGSRPGIRIRRNRDDFGRLGPVKRRRSRRFIPLPPGIVALLRRWLLVVPRGNALPDPAQPGKRIHLLFPTSIGTAQSRANVTNRAWAPALIKAGLYEEVPATRLVDGKRAKRIRRRPLYPLNSLRHLAASLLIDRGVGPKQIQHHMGHSSIKVTFDVYGHLFAARETETDALAAIERDLQA